MASATSAGSPTRPSGTSGPTRSTRPGSPASAWMVVRTMPGATPTTRMPSPATSIASPVVRASRPAFAAAYWTYSCGAPRVAAPDETLTTTPPEPPRPVLISRTAARAQRMAAVRFRSTVRRTTSVEASASGPMLRVAPALLTRPVTVPSSAARPNSRSTPASVVRSARTRFTSGPCSRTALAVDSAASSSDAYPSTRSWPSAARRWAVAAPMPRVPPVMTVSMPGPYGRPSSARRGRVPAGRPCAS